TSTRTGVPFAFTMEEVTISGIPLARVDRTSVVIAYLRALFAVLFAMGWLSIAFGILYLTGDRPAGEFGRIGVRVLFVALAVGTVGGLLTYAIPLTSARERDIRRFCAERLGLAADPARVSAELSKRLADYIGNNSQDSDDPRGELVRQLILARARIA